MLPTADRGIGEDVSQGDLLGKAGSSGYVVPGLKESGRLGFELRLHGVPIRPTEWWDGSWQREHIDQEIRLVKRNFGVLSEDDKEQDKSGSKQRRR